jgi:hypothetical protein
MRKYLYFAFYQFFADRWDEKKCKADDGHDDPDQKFFVPGRVTRRSRVPTRMMPGPTTLSFIGF